jgi:hypothetical protein
MRVPRALVILGCAVVLVVGGAVAYAAIPSANGVFTACINKTSGAVRIIDTATAQRCSSNELRRSWNQQGADGVSGYQKVVSTHTFPAGTGAAGGFGVQADCPTGKVATGGGGSFVDANGDPVTFNSDVVNASFPTPDSTGWVIVLTGSSFDTKDITGISAYVLCAAAN